jgi:uncharacterized protein (TIGR04255 family)
MHEKPRFFTLLPAHAIERCSAAVVFDQQLPSKLFDKTVLACTASLRELHFSPAAPTPALNVEVDGATGLVSVKNSTHQPAVFTSVSGAQLTFAPNAIQFQTAGYVRWSPFLGDFERATSAILNACLSAVSVSAVKLEYWDRFIWTGDWTNFDRWQLFKKNSEFLSLAAAAQSNQWHSHCGWFENVNENKRLVNINVDVVEVIHNARVAPSVGIYTMMQDVHSSTLQTPRQIVTNLDQLHLSLKKLFDLIIEVDIAKQIGLQSGTTT